MNERHSIRAFKETKIEQGKVQKILETLNSAPSAGNLQAYEVVLVKDPDKRLKLARAAYGQSFIASAQLILVFFANPERSSKKYGPRGSRFYCIQDATIAVAYAQLAAISLDLGSVWVGAFDDGEVSRAVNAPRELIPVAVLPIGYPDEKPHETPRRNLNDLVRENSF